MTKGRAARTRTEARPAATDQSQATMLEVDEAPALGTIGSTVARIDPDGTLAVELDEGVSSPASAVRAPTGGGFERYVLQQPLGRQGVGQLYLVLDRDLKRQLLLKMTAIDADAMPRLLEEAQVAGQLDHPHIANVHDIGVADGEQLFYTMPFTPGRTLADVIGALKAGDEVARETYTTVRLIQIYLHVLEALGFAHAHGVIHRDLTPANVWIGEHGEVQVTNWGHAKVVEESSIATDRTDSMTRMGEVVGTAAYVSPEQVSGGDLGPSADIYGLGVVLYELLTLVVPFRGTASEVHHQHLTVMPVAPRTESDRQIAPELERICLRALAKEPGERQASVLDMYAEVQAWLDEESDRIKRDEKARRLIEDGRRCLDEFVTVRDDIRRREHEAHQLAKQFGSETGVADVASEGQVELAMKGHEVMAALSEALGAQRDNPEARGLLAEYWWTRYLEAEERADIQGEELAARLLERYDDGRFREKLLAPGVVTIESEPAGARAWIYPLNERAGKRVAGTEVALGETPIGALEVASGSHLIVLKLDDHRVARVPILVERGAEQTVRAALVATSDVDPHFVQVVGGPFARGLERQMCQLDEFFIAEHPVTVGEYLVFLGAVGKGEARTRAPRVPDGALLVKEGDGGFELPDESDLGSWSERWPVFGVSLEDAAAYAAWRSVEDGRSYRVPTEDEWEKAARGVDGRCYPWGDRFDASLCNMAQSGRSRPCPATIDEFAEDLSVYGMRGAAGNVREWTVRRPGSARLRGGSWASSSDDCRLDQRRRQRPDEVAAATGFRLAFSR